MDPLEIQDATNPLLEHLHLPVDLVDIAHGLAFDPLKGIDPSHLKWMSKLDLLCADKVPLRPTASGLRIAMTIISMVRSSYRARNVTSASGRRAVDQAIQCALNGYAGPPLLGTSVFVLMGVTGVAKTVTVEHTLRMFGPQVIRHEDRPDAMWVRATQLVWLMVSMSHDGSRGGLLNNILLKVDQALGSDRGTRLHKQYRTVERLAGAVVALLQSLYIGVLVIDEIQLANLVEAEQAHKMHLFLLNLINSGIPVILIGNPAGFSWLSRLSQDATRLAAIPSVFVHPVGSVDDGDDWEPVYEGVSAYYVMDEPPVDPEDCKRVLLTKSGGIARCALTLWCNAQRLALFEKRTSICSGDVETAHVSEDFDPIRDLCDGFARKDAVRLMRWRETDIPLDYYARRWKVADAASAAMPATVSTETSGGSTKPRTSPDAVRARRGRPPNSARAQMQASESRAAKREQTRKELAAVLDPDDMRAEGIRLHALKGLKELLAADEVDAPR